MKRIAPTLLAAFWVSSVSFATGLKTTVYQCGHTFAESSVSMVVEKLEGAAPGGRVWTSYQAFLSSGGAVTGLRSSGLVKVEPSVSAEGRESYNSKNGEFALHILEKANVVAEEYSLRVKIEGKYVDVNSGAPESLEPTWLICI